MRKSPFFLSVMALWTAVMTVQAQPVFLAKLHDFGVGSDGKNPGPMQLGPDNALYGVTWLGGDSNLVNDGYPPAGTVFKMNRDGSGYKVLHTFSFTETRNGAPPTPVIPSGNNGFSICVGNDGMIYGTMLYGTNNSASGMIFKCNTDGADFQFIHAFSNSGGDSAPLNLLQGRDGTLYGTTAGTVFALDTAGGNYRVLHTFSSGEGAYGVGRLLQGKDGALYGTAALSADDGTPAGSVFKITTNGAFSVLHVFPAFNNDGIEPAAGLIQASDGSLFGTTLLGGTNQLGTIFNIHTDGTAYQILHNFPTGDASSSDGARPYGELVQGINGLLYGTTLGGVNSDATGTIFKIGLDGNGYNVLTSFSASTNGTRPYAGLVSGPSAGTNGVLYGTATAGGSGQGTIFALTMNPPLSITPLTSQTPDGHTVVYWPAWAFNYTLQTTTNLASNNWTTVSNAVPVSAVAVTNTAPAAYFRLIYQ